MGHSSSAARAGSLAALIVVATSTSRRHTAPSRRTAASSEGRGSAAPPSSRPASNIRESASSCPATGCDRLRIDRRRALGHAKHLGARPAEHGGQEFVRDALTVPDDERRRRPAVLPPGVHPRRAAGWRVGDRPAAARLGGQQVDPLLGGARQPRHQRDELQEQHEVRAQLRVLGPPVAWELFGGKLIEHLDQLAAPDPGPQDVVQPRRRYRKRGVDAGLRGQDNTWLISTTHSHSDWLRAWCRSTMAWPNAPSSSSISRSQVPTLTR